MITFSCPLRFWISIFGWPSSCPRSADLQLRRITSWWLSLSTTFEWLVGWDVCPVWGSKLWLCPTNPTCFWNYALNPIKLSFLMIWLVGDSPIDCFGSGWMKIVYRYQMSPRYDPEWKKKYFWVKWGLFALFGLWWFECALGTSLRWVHSINTK